MDAMSENDKPQALNPEIVPPGMESTPPFKKPRERSKTRQATDLAVAGLVASGISANKAAGFLGIAPSTAYRAMERLEGEGKEISSLKTVERDERLCALLDAYMDKGKTIDKLKPSDALGAARIYADRSFPVLRQDGPRHEFNFVKVDISLYDREDYGTRAHNMPEDKE